MTGNVHINGSSNLEIAQSNQDLIMTKSKKNKRRCLIAATACIVGAALVVALIVLLARMDGRRGPAPGAALALEDILRGGVNPKSFNATWVSGDEILFVDHENNVVLRNLATDNRTILISGNDPIIPLAFEFSLSADRNYLLISYFFQKIYRHSYRARFTMVHLHTKERTELELNGTVDFNLFVWSPAPGNAFAFVHENNIYYKEGVVASEAVQITNDSKFIYNGVPDWVYEEEIFSSNKALWFSPDGRRIAYGRFDDTNTPLMGLPIYGEPGNANFQYPRLNLVRYPKAGTPNPAASLHVVDVANAALVRRLQPPDDLVLYGPLLTAVEWATSTVVTAIWMNRIQNRASIVAYSTEELNNTQIIKSLHQQLGWLELFSAPVFSKDGSTLAIILSQDQGGKLGSYRHIALLKREPNAKVEALTKGAFVVTEILGWNHDNNLIYYLANTVNDSAVQHLYSVSPSTKTTNCLSCNIKSKHDNGVNCLYNSAKFSKDSSFYLLMCDGPEVPTMAFYSTESGEIYEWENNEALVQLKRSKRTPRTARFSVEVAGGFRAQVMLRLPPELDEGGGTKYPMLVNVYAGPDSYQVVERFNLDWGSYLAANKSIIYATIDGRSSGLKGDKMLFASYRKLGSVEIADQINVTRQIQSMLPYVDAERTAIWGWSYGGYASGMALANDDDGIFKCGISVAPVTDWTLYDSIYTERFMGLPTLEDNLRGYKEASLLTKFEGLRNKQYFLIHGTYDDNVHYQQSMLWAKVLEQNDILFRQLSYPDEDHGLSSVRPHLYHSLEKFLDECFIKEM